ncbi:MAG: hypothetical protein QOD77_1437 [Thermoplasmata archaeon]|jgi:hypothetical protein|nr:hypothetical protein [Thermoplasmata archaeon]
MAATRLACGMKPTWAVAVALALLPLLAGCMQSAQEPPAPLPEARLRMVGGVRNQQVTVDPPTRQANELSVAVDPTDARNLLATGKDYTQPYAGECVWDGIYVSHDGGASWSNGNLMGSPWKARADLAAGGEPETHAQLSRFYCATDPVVAWGPDGTAYWSVMPYQCDPASGSKTGAELLPGVGLPPGGANDWLWTCSSMYVLASEDKGDTWTTVSEVAFGPRLQHDKQWLAVSPPLPGVPGGRVLLCWDQDDWASGALADDYAALTQDSDAPPYPDDLVVPDQPVPTATVCATSEDRAATWSPPAVAHTSLALPWVEFGPDGTAFMLGVNGTHVLASHSRDGLAWHAPVPVGGYTDPASTIMNGFTALNGSVFRTFALPSLAIDRSDGPSRGTLYATWMDAASGLGRTMLAVSRDGGANWTSQWIHGLLLDDGNARGDQFMPAVSVGPDGTVDLSWNDRRMDPTNHLFDLYYAYSVDGGRTFSKALRVSDVASDEQYSHHQNGAIFLGDYRDLDSAAGTAHPVWVDTRNGKADVYTATIERPSANQLAP